MAAVHNARLAACAPLQLFIADKLDAVVHNRETPSQALVQQLLHQDQPWPAAAGAAGGPGAAAAAEALSYALRLSISCPKLGVAVAMRSPAAMPAPAPIDPTNLRPAYVQLTLHSILAEVAPSGARMGRACWAQPATHRVRMPVIRARALNFQPSCLPASRLPVVDMLPFPAPSRPSPLPCPAPSCFCRLPAAAGRPLGVRPLLLPAGPRAPRCQDCQRPQHGLPPRVQGS